MKYFDSMKMNLQFVVHPLMLGHNVKVIIYTILLILLQLDQRDVQRLFFLKNIQKSIKQSTNEKKRRKKERSVNRTKKKRIFLISSRELFGSKVPLSFTDRLWLHVKHSTTNLLTGKTITFFL